MEPIVEISDGKLRGKKCSRFNNKSYLAFKGIPYAKPPLGELRFKPPQPCDPWDGVRDAIEHGNSSRSRDLLNENLYIGSEDCLYLNVYTPNLKENEGELKPVLFYIHGGGFELGNGNTDLFGPDFFMLESQVILVTINYRLGAAGFMAFKNPEFGISGNAGLKDMVMALKWVNKNIKEFGGDANNITIFGESAGAAAVHYLVLSKQTKGLIHKAICQSGTALCEWAVGQPRPFELAALLGCTSDNEQEVLDFLQTVSIEKMVEYQDMVINETDLREGITLFWGPIVETYNSESAIITEPPIDIMLSGSFNHIPMIFGHTTDEGLFFISKLTPKNLYLHPNFKDNEVLVPNYLNLKQGSEISKKVGDELKQFYYADTKPSGHNLQPFVKVMTDIVFAVWTHFTAMIHSKMSTQPIYVYKFNVDTKFSILKMLFDIPLPGVTHGDDLSYLFSNAVIQQLPAAGSLAEKTIRRMTNMWANFAYCGNPNNENDELLDEMWKPFTGAEQNYLKISEDLECCTNEYDLRLQLWTSLFKRFKKEYIV